MNRLLTSILIAVASIATSSAYILRANFVASSVVAAGTVVATQGGYQGTSSVELDPTRTNSYPAVRVTLQISAYYKGTGPAEINVFVPESYANFSSERDERKVFNVRVGEKGLWLLQTPRDTDGAFDEMANSVPLDYGFTWRVPGAQFAPLCSRGSGAVYHLDVIPAAPATADPLLKLADLFARNAALKNPRYGRYLALVQELTPEEIKIWGFDRAVEGENKTVERMWIRNVFPALFSPDNGEQLMNMAATEAMWLVPGAMSHFIAAYESHPQWLRTMFPIVTETPDMVRLLPIVDKDVAAYLFTRLGGATQFRSVILSTAIARFDQGNTLDIAILKCLDTIFPGHDLNPVVNGHLVGDLEPLKARARQIHL